MGKLTQYNSQSPVGAPQASPNEFGAIEANAGGQLAQAVQNTGQAMAEIGIRRQRRADTVKRVRDTRALDSDLRTELNTRDETGDFIGNDSYEEYKAWGNSRVDEYVAAHEGSARSKSMLKERLIQVAHGYDTQAYKLGSINQHKFITEEAESYINKSVAAIHLNPEMINEELLSIQFHLNDISDALDADTDTALRRGAVSTLYKTAVNAHLAKGEYEQAEALMSEDLLQENTDPEQYRSMTGDVIKVRHNKLSYQAAVENKIQSIELITGPMTPQEKSLMRGMPITKGNQGIPQQLAEFSIVSGKPVSPAMMDKAYAMEYSRKGRIDPEENVIEYLGMLKKGIRLGDADLSRLQGALMEAYGPEEYVDAQSNRTTMGEARAIPEQIYNDLQDLGISHFVDGVKPPREDTGNYIVDYDANEPSVYELVAAGAGILPSTERFLEKMPTLGRMQSMDQTQIKTKLQNVSRKLVEVFSKQRGSIKHAGERKELLAQLGLLQSIWQNKESSISKLYGIRDSLIANQKIEVAIISDPNTTTKFYREAQDRNILITETLRMLNLPPVVYTEADMLSHPPGTVVVAATRGWVMRITPKDGASDEGSTGG